MKTSEFKKLIKESVREVIQEELKDILLEAIKSPKHTTNPPLTETLSYPSPNTKLGIPPTPTTTISPEQRRAIYESMLGETAMSFTSNNTQTFKPTPGVDTINGSLPDGSVSMDQIMSLMSNK